MADTPFGLRPLRGYSGNDLIECVVPASDGTALFVGDAVKLHGDADTTYNAPTVIQAAAGNPIFGVVVGLVPDYDNLTRKYRTASTLRRVQVCMARPSIVFEIQANAAMTTSMVGSHFDLVVGSGDTTTGRSGMEIDTDGTPAGAGTTAQLLLLGPSRTVNETFDTAAAGTNVEVTIFESQFNAVATGLSV